MILKVEAEYANGLILPLMEIVNGKRVWYPENLPPSKPLEAVPEKKKKKSKLK